MNFIGRTAELEVLQSLAANPLAVATITGRRRVGKSRLVSEYAARAGRTLIRIDGRDAPHANNEMQLRAFANDLSRDTGIPGFSFNDWNAAFNGLGALSKGKQWVILLDEITWLAKYSGECLAELKVFIDTHINGSGNQLIICGSISQWIEEFINESDSFVGRISKKIRLRPLPLPDCAKFWQDRQVSTTEILTALCVTGGIPRYLEEIDVRESAEWNIQKLCFDSTGYMVHELPNLIKSSFLQAERGGSNTHSNVERYLNILGALAEHGKMPAEISKAIKVENNEHLKNNLTSLVMSGIVSENPSWNLKSKAFNQRNIVYRIDDPYTRFYIKYIRPNLNEIEKGLYSHLTLRQLGGWETIRGFQFQSLVNQSMVPFVTHRLKLTNVPIRRCGPYYRKGTSRHPAVQIDYLLQTDDTLYVCETKFRKKINASVIEEVKKKIENLDKPKGITVRRVLLFSGQRTQELADSIYFDHQIRVDELLGLPPL